MEKDSDRILTVKELDVEDQPRERALKYGVEVLSTADLWAIVLRTGIQGKPITELCRDLMRDNDSSLYNLERQPLQKIMETPGIGSTKALQIKAVMEISKRYNKESLGKKYRITGSNSIFEYMRYDIGNLPHEEIWAIYLNRQNMVIGKSRITTGSAVASIFDLKKIMREALMNYAEALVLCHNHPSGNLLPSPDDDRITRMMRDAAKTMDIRMLDHVIVTAEGFYSYFDSGKL